MGVSQSMYISALQENVSDKLPDSTSAVADGLYARRYFRWRFKDAR